MRKRIVQASHLSTFWHLDGQREETLKKFLKLGAGEGGMGGGEECQLLMSPEQTEFEAINLVLS